MAVLIPDNPCTPKILYPHECYLVQGGQFLEISTWYCFINCSSKIDIKACDIFKKEIWLSGGKNLRSSKNGFEFYCLPYISCLSLTKLFNINISKHFSPCVRLKKLPWDYCDNYMRIYTYTRFWNRTDIQKTLSCFCFFFHSSSALLFSKRGIRNL